MGFLDPFGPFLAHFDPPWGPLEPPMQPFGGSERLAGAAMTGRGAEAPPRGGGGGARARMWENPIDYQILHLFEMSCDRRKAPFFVDFGEKVHLFLLR